MITRVGVPWLVVLVACGRDAGVPPYDAGGAEPDSGSGVAGVPVPVLVVDPTRDSFAFPLHPELSRPCARVENAAILNDGGGSFAVTDFTSEDPAFSMQGTCAPVTRSQPCRVSFCFASTLPGTHIVTGMVHTNIGFFETPLGVTVTAPAPDLDLSFHGTGGTAVDSMGDAYNNLDALELAGGTAIAGGARLMLWSRWNAITVDSSGTESDRVNGTTINGFIVNWFRAPMHDDGQYVYAIAGDESGGSLSAIVRFDETGATDTAFIPIDLPQVNGGYWVGLEVAPSGRLLAIAGDSQTTVVAIANGAVDPTWGTNGEITLTDTYPFAGGRSAIDSQGRLYLGYPDHVVRLTAAGAVDAAFAYAGTVGALAVDGQDHLLVGGASAVSLLDDTGAVTATFAAPAAVNDLALDGLGRMYVTAAGQTARYAADGTFDRELGIGSTYGVRCKGSAHCWLYGVETHVTPMEQEFDIYEMYALRLAD